MSVGILARVDFLEHSRGCQKVREHQVVQKHALRCQEEGEHGLGDQEDFE